MGKNHLRRILIVHQYFTHYKIYIHYWGALIEYVMCNTYTIHTVELKCITLYYDLWMKIVCNVFKRCYSVVNIMKFIWISEVQWYIFYRIQVCEVFMTVLHKRICLRSDLMEKIYSYLIMLHYIKRGAINVHCWNFTTRFLQ